MISELTCVEVLMFDTPPGLRDYAYQRQSRLIDSQSVASIHSVTVKKSLDATPNLIKTSPPRLTTRQRRRTETGTQTHQQTDEQTDRRTDRQTDDGTMHEYHTIDDLRREPVTYNMPLAQFSNHAEIEYETIPDVVHQLSLSNDSELSSAAGAVFSDLR